MSSCANADYIPLQVMTVQQTLLDSIPSGSGMVMQKDSLYIVGDDAANVYKLHILSKAYTKIPLDDASGYRLDRRVKPDYEAAVVVQYKGKDYLLALGSGSMSPHRDSLLIMNMVTVEQAKISLAPLYGAFRKVSGKDTEINIEGIAIAGNNAYILNRSKGYVYRMNRDELMSYIFSPSYTLPAFKTYQVKLPEKRGLTAGLSGACKLDEGRLLICASLENTPNATTDGEVRGSYIGILDVSNDKEIKLEAIGMVRDGKRKKLKEKVESLVYLGKDNENKIRILAVADNDNGTSKLLELSVGE
jgi:hypothetical protein